jgi:lipoic acid synthetase
MRKPAWIRVQTQSSEKFREVRRAVQSNKLHTVCEEAKCPNMQECWGLHRTATFLLLGKICTRACRFCAVEHGRPMAPDLDEPKRVANTALQMSLQHIVLTMVNRDDLPDGGATLIAQTIEELRLVLPQASIEILVGDFCNNQEAIDILLQAKPDILAHNIETVARLSPHIRSKSSYQTSLAFLLACSSKILTIKHTCALKSGIMLGLGENKEEILHTLRDLYTAGVRIVTMGQYLQASSAQIPVSHYWHPSDFEDFGKIARAEGMHSVVSGPLVRSSYCAASQYAEFRKPQKD